MSSKTANVVDSIDDMLREIGTAAEKSAESNTEAGGYQGGSSHPSASVDDKTETAQEGARSSENTSDVKEDQGAPSVENTTAGTPGGQDSVQMNIGTNQSATGEDSSVETSSAKGGKDDPGTQRGSSTHPARTDNDSLDGGKYASLIEKAGKLEEVGRDLVAAIAVAADGEVQKRAQELADGQASADAPAEPTPEKVATEQPATDEQGAVPDSDQLAKQAATVDAIAMTVQDGLNMADKVAAYLGHYAAAEKAAMPEEGEETDPTQPEKDKKDSPSSGESTEEPAESGGDGYQEEQAPPEGDTGEGDMLGEEPPMDAPPMGEPPAGEAPMGQGPSEDALLSALSGGGDIGAEEALGGMAGGEPGGMPPEAGGMPPEAGGMPPEAGGDLAGLLGGAPEGMPPEAGGLPPEAGGMPGGELGGMPPEAGGMPGMGEGPSEEDLMLLEQALAAAGITPEELEAAVAAKAAQAVVQRKHAREKAAREQAVAPAKWRPKNAEQAARYQETLKFVNEIVGSKP
ncbi:MAG: hypothetical protein ACYSWU_04315 [Planctomycetota bacterium]|jgi:hypothetical protein